MAAQNEGQMLLSLLCPDDTDPQKPMNENCLINPTDDLPFKDRLGRCYELAGLLTIHNPEVMLVHGSIQNFNKPRLAHAWVELPDGTKWEPATNQIWSRSSFGAFFHPQVTRKYANRAALEKFLHFETYGPWN